MAALSAPSCTDRPSYAEYTRMVQRERELLDSRQLVQDHLKWLDQAMTFLALRSDDPTNDPSVLTSISAIEENKETLAGIVSSCHQVFTCLKINYGHRRGNCKHSPRRGDGAGRTGPL